MKHEMNFSLKKLLNELNLHPQILGKYIIQPLSWFEDDNGNMIYDIESIKEEFDSQIRELEEHNEEIEGLDQ
jgi:hypothetical protein